MFAELSITSNFTFLTGASHPEEFVARAASLGLSALAIADENSVAGIVRAHAALRDLARVVAEFAEELDRMGLTFPQGLTGALTALEGRISPQTAARLRKEAGVRQLGDPWGLIREQEIDALLPIACLCHVKP